MAQQSYLSPVQSANLIRVLTAFEVFLLLKLFLLIGVFSGCYLWLVKS
jgi:hypothetical protein